MPRKKRPIPALAKRGSSGYRHYTGILQEEWHPKLQGKDAAKVYRQIYDNDGYAGGALRTMKYFIGGAEFPLAPQEDYAKDPIALEWAKWTDEMFGDMESTWSEMMSSVLTTPVFGYCIMYKEFKLRRGNDSSDLLNSKYNDGLFGYKDIEIRAQETIDQWEVNSKTNKLEGAWQIAAPRWSREFLDRDRFALFRLDPNKGSPEGRSLLRNVYRPWFLKTRLEEIRCIGEERNLAGFPVIEMPPHMLQEDAKDEEKAAASDMALIAQQMKVDQLQGLVFPSELDTDGMPTGFKIRLLSSGARDRGSITNAIKDHRHEYLVALNYEMVSLGEAKTGSYSMHKDKSHLMMLAISYIMDVIVDVFNRDIIPHIMWLNKVPQKYWPIMSHGEIEQADIIAMLTVWNTLVTGGSVVSTEKDETHIRELLEFPVREPDDVPLPVADQGFGMDGDPLAGMGPPMPVAPVIAEPPPIDLNAPVDPEIAMTVDEAAQRLGVNRKTLMSQINRGKIPGAKFGNSFRIMPEDLKTFMQITPPEPKPQPTGAQWQTPSIV